MNILCAIYNCINNNKTQHEKLHQTNYLQFVFDLMIIGKGNNNLTVQEFICVSEAPVDTAVKMAKEFRLLAVKEKERARDLLNMGDYCESMGTEITAISSSMVGAASLLKSHDSRGIPFLDVLIECEQKEVVAHASVQKYLSDVWVSENHRH